MKYVFRFLLLLLASRGHLAEGQLVPRYYHSILLDSVGLRFPGGGQLAQPILNPFKPVRIATRLNLIYPAGYANESNGQPLYAISLNTQYNYTQLINRFNDSLHVGWSRPTLGLPVPWPGRPRYYILIGPTHSRQLPPLDYSLSYTILDQQGNGGRGWISDDSAYFPLRDTLMAETQSLLARHRSGHGFWLLNIRPSGDLIAHRVDSTGVRLPPVVSQLAPFNITTSTSTMRLRLSLNQRRAVITIDRLDGGAMALDTTDLIGLNFDDSTGRFTDPQLFYRYGFAQGLDSLDGPIHLLALSPQGRYAYCYQYIVTDTLALTNRLDLYQYDLLAGSQAAVRASARRLSSRTVDGRDWHNVFVGPDARVYLPVTRGSVDVIDCPDQPAPACSFRPSAITFPTRRFVFPGSSIDAFFTFPTPHADILPLVQVSGATARDQACMGQPVTFALTQATGLDSARWTFGDGSPAAAGLAVSHAFVQPGTYAVTGVYFYRCAQDTVRRTITISAPLTAPLLRADSLRCGQPTTLRVRAPADVAWQWADGASADTVRTVSQPGTYGVRWQRGGCAGAEQFPVAAPVPCPPLVLPNILTPDGDGRNDAFRVEAPGPWTLRVYNRWGRQVWQSAPGAYATEWAGQGVPAGTYYYLLTRPATPAGGGAAATEAASYKGWVEVVR